MKFLYTIAIFFYNLNKNMGKNGLLAALFLSGAVLFLASCGEIIPNFSDTPQIEFDNVVVNPLMSASGRRLDTIAITIKFQDGDGDVGIVANPDTSTWNYFITPYKKFRGVWRKVRFPDPSSESAFTRPFVPVLKEDGRSGPIEGILTYKVDITQRIEFPIDEMDSLTFLNEDTLKFEIFIRDRAGNRSNTVESNSFPVLQPR